MKSFLQANQRINRVTDSHVAGFKKAIEDAPGYGGGAFTTPKRTLYAKTKSFFAGSFGINETGKGKSYRKMNLEELRTKYKADILKIAEKYGVTDIRVFGSVARGDAREDSDVDFLAKFPPKTGFIKFGQFESEIKEIMPVDIDILSENGVHKFIRDEIFRDAVSL